LTTSAEIGVAARAWAWAKRAFALAKRIAALEARVEALEEAIQRQLPDACPKCGERAMRRMNAGRVLGEPGKQWRYDSWKCLKCGDEETRAIQFK
jgi:predicted RNA-binding Zn-ribbon protein involved in translation (DUF1610 family)